MTNYILRGELGFNTFYIKNEIEGMKIITRDDELPPLTGDDHVIRWGTTRHVPNGPKILNRLKSISETSNKGMFRKKVGDAGLAPKTWIDLKGYLKSFIEFVPVIIRPHFHQRSEHVYMCNSITDVGQAVDAIGNEFYISEYIPKEKEYRVFVAQGRPFIVVEKMPEDRNAITWGCVEAGNFEYIPWDEWPEEVVRVATESFLLSGLDFAAIDIIYKDGRAYFLEANTAPEILGYYGASFAKVFKHMFANGRERIPVVDYTNWKNCIHPAMSNKAVV